MSTTIAAGAGVGAPRVLRERVERFDAEAFDARRHSTRVRLEVRGSGVWDAVLREGRAELELPRGEPDALIAADAAVWRALGGGLARGMSAYSSGRIEVRRNLHVGVGFLAATAVDRGPGRMRFRSVRTRGARLSIVEAGIGAPVLALHGLGATKASFLTTLAALSGDFRVIAVDQPGFGDSDKPIGARYDAAFFARAAVELLDALEIDRAHVVGNSLGGRVALEIGIRHPERVRRLGLLAPSLAWRRGGALRPIARLARPELGLLQLAPRRVVEGLVQRLIPEAGRGWTAAGVDEFLRAYLTPTGRAAFYAAARQIVLEQPDGERGFWSRLATLQPRSLFVWGRHDRLVPLAFARHVETALPRARHLELTCGHVPQIELPGPTHRALGEFFAAERRAGAG